MLSSQLSLQLGFSHRLSFSWWNASNVGCQVFRRTKLNYREWTVDSFVFSDISILEENSCKEFICVRSYIVTQFAKRKVGLKGKKLEKKLKLNVVFPLLYTYESEYEWGLECEAIKNRIGKCCASKIFTMMHLCSCSGQRPSATKHRCNFFARANDWYAISSQLNFEGMKKSFILVCCRCQLLNCVRPIHQSLATHISQLGSPSMSDR